MDLGVAYGWVLGNPGASAMSSITLGRTHMTVKVRDDKVLYKPKESRTEVEMTGEDSVKMPKSWFFHWVGLRENLQETHGFLPSNIGFSCKFSHHPIL